MTHLASFNSLIKFIKNLISNQDQQPDSQVITEKFKNVVEMLVDAQKTGREEVYDLFCELQVMDLLQKMMKYNKQVVIRTLSLILINLKNQLWIGHLMADKLVPQLIDSTIDEENQQLIEHYISFLKSISIRLDLNNLSLFYNKKYSVFPLLSKGLTFYNHPDNMVRTSVMNLTLGIMKIKDPRLSKYFSALPFTLYIVHFCHSLNYQWKQLNKIISDNNLTKHRLKMEISDQNDSMFYLYDLFQHGSLNVKNNIKNIFFSTCVLPMLINQILKEEISPKLCLYLIHSILKVFKERDICEFIAVLLFGKRLNTQIIKKINHIPHVPLSWKPIYDNQEKSFFDSFNYQITDHCEQIFKDIANFETQHQYKKLSGDTSPNSSEFYEQAQRISDSIGFNVLFIQETKPFDMLQKCREFQNSEDNPVRAKLLKLFKQGDDSMVWVITNIIIGIQKKEQISNDALKYCGLLMPKMDTVNYLDDFNINSMIEIKEILLNHLKLQTNYRITTSRNIIYLLSELMFKQMSKQQLLSILHAYQESIVLLKSDLKVDNLSHIALTFFDDFKRWSNHSFLPEGFIPFSLFSSPKESFPQIKNEEHLPTNQKQGITRNIQLFALNRMLVTSYRVEFMKIDRDSLPSFQQEYILKFNHTSTKWKVGKSYPIENKTLVECKEVFNDKRKAINLLLVEDPYNFVLVDPSSDNYSGSIYFNVRFKHMTFELMKNDPRNILITWACENSGEKMLGFNNDIQAMEIFQRINKRIRESYEQKQGYILKFIQSCQKDLKSLIASQN